MSDDDNADPKKHNIKGDNRALYHDMIDFHSDNMSDEENTHIDVFVERAVLHGDIHTDISPQL